MRGFDGVRARRGEWRVKVARRVCVCVCVCVCKRICKRMRRETSLPHACACARAHSPARKRSQARTRERIHARTRVAPCLHTPPETTHLIHPRPLLSMPLTLASHPGDESLHTPARIVTSRGARSIYDDRRPIVGRPRRVHHTAGERRRQHNHHEHFHGCLSGLDRRALGVSVRWRGARCRASLQSNPDRQP